MTFDTIRRRTVAAAVVALTFGAALLDEVVVY